MSAMLKSQDPIPANVGLELRLGLGPRAYVGRYSSKLYIKTLVLSSGYFFLS